MQVGHTGVYDAAVQAIGATDKAVKTVYDACEEAGYVLAITADHGNAEQMLDPETGTPFTAHTTSESQNRAIWLLLNRFRPRTFHLDRGEGLVGSIVRAGRAGGRRADSAGNHGYSSAGRYVLEHLFE